MNTPTPEQISKLPKWAREHIKSLDRELGAHKEQLKRFVEEQKSSPFFVDEWHAEPRFKRYIPTVHNRVCVEHLGIHCEIFLPYEGDGQRLQGIEISWRDCESSLEASAAIVPRGISTIQLVRKDQMR